MEPLKKYRIADLNVEMLPRHNPLKKQSLSWQFDYIGNSDSNANLYENEYDFLRARHSDLSDGLLEYMYTASKFYSDLILHQGIFIHASAVAVDEKAYLFSAPSGTGKSTHTALWTKVFGERALILNDDKPAVRIVEDQIYAYGTPWSGKTDQSINRRIPLQGICFLSRGEKNKINRISPSKAIPKLLEQTLLPDDKTRMNLLLDTVQELMLRTPIFEMQCNMDPSAAVLSYETMLKGNEKQ